jgi:hypothetical protein
MTRKPTDKQEQNHINNLVRVFRNRLFIDDESEAQCLWEAQMLCAASVAKREHVDWTDIGELIEEFAVEVKPKACLIVELAKKAGRP